MLRIIDICDVKRVIVKDLKYNKELIIIKNHKNERISIIKN